MSWEGNAGPDSGEIVSEVETIPMPAPSAWPMVVAAGAALMATGIATSIFVSVAGLVILLVAIGGWVAQLAPGQGEIEEPLLPPDQRAGQVPRSQRTIAQPREGLPGHRAHFPERVHPYSAGAIGGLLGGGVMAGIAMMYGQVSGRGIWYPINMLSGMILPNLDESSTVAELAQYDQTTLVVAAILHLTFSILAGLFFGIILPMLPRVLRIPAPVFWGGFIAPLIWTGAVYGLMGVLNPVMNRLVDWEWFIASQFAYGLTLGICISFWNKVPAKRIQGESIAGETP